ncbi:urease accessory protein UreJ [Candidatus Peregrinibacteria bacterium CG_4_9_14_0_2_um_filter_53_11]|nr:MAG: urease accessory protein UreJ [Candidatus Peregrinibacteria bacterium CG_4_9_14_0_2_um_filter_53_11]
MKNSRTLLRLILGGLLLVPAVAQAHLVGGSGLSDGLTHPLLGIDHLLAMVAVGVVGSQLGASARWKLPAAFVGSMIIGGALALIGLNLPATESGIALSLIMLGSFIALALSSSTKISISWAALPIALFGLVHGHAHGNEMGVVSTPSLYFAGFVTATALLHITGITLGQLARKTEVRQNLLRYAGTGMGLAGLFLIF